MGLTRVVEFDWYGGQRQNKGMVFSNTIFEDFRIKKSRVNFDCCVCGKKKNKGNRYIGHTYEKVCLDCMIEWLEKTKMTFLEFINTINKDLNEIKLKKDKWLEEQFVNNI